MADEGTIRVQGHGEVEAAPDRARVMLGVQTADANVRAAVESNSQTVESVLEAVKGAGVPDTGVQQSQFNIYFDQQNTVYTVHNQVTVLVQDVEAVGQVLGSAIGAGANVAGGITFELSDSSEAEAEALRRAANDARSRAETLAGSLGLTLDTVISVDAPPLNQAVPRPMFARMAQSLSAAAPVPLAGGQLTISADVEIVFHVGPADRH